MTNPQDQTQAVELFKVLDKISELNKLVDRGHGDLADTCYICGISPSNLKQLIDHYANQRALELLDELEALCASDHTHEIHRFIATKRLNLTKKG